MRISSPNTSASCNEQVFLWW